MKKIYLLSAFIFTSINFYSQNCDFKLNGKDKYSEKYEQLLVNEMYDKNSEHLTFQLQNTEDFLTLNLIFVEENRKANNWSCTSSDHLIIIFEDGSKMNLVPVEPFYVSILARNVKKELWWGNNEYGKTNRYIFTPAYILSNSDLQTLGEKKISSIRITAKGKDRNSKEEISNIELTIEKKHSELLIQNAICLRKNLHTKVNDKIIATTQGVLAKVMNPSFSEDYEKQKVILNVEYFKLGMTEVILIANKVKKYVIFQCIEIDGKPNNLLGTEFGYLFCIKKENSDILFSLKSRDKLKIIGTTFTHDYYGDKTVYFIVESIEKI